MKTFSLKPMILKMTKLSLAVLATTSLSVITTAWNKPAVAAEQPRIFSVAPGVANNALNGNWRLSWRYDGIPHNAWLHMDGNYGNMTVNAILPNGRRIVAQEAMRLIPDGNGFILSGSNPVYPGSWRRDYDYNPDSFRIWENNNGSLIVSDCSSGACVPVSIVHQLY